MKQLLLLLFSVFISSSISAQNSLYVICEDGSLYRTDPSSCSAQLIGFTRLTVTDIAIHPTTKELYGIGGISRELYHIDKETARIISSVTLSLNTVFLNSLTFDEDGMLYAASVFSDHLYRIDPDTGEMTDLGSTNTGVFSGGDLTFYNDLLYLAGESQNLVQIDLDDVSNSVVLGAFNTNTTAEVYGYTFVNCPASVYASIDNHIYELTDEDNRELSLRCSAIVPRIIYGMASINENEEPLEVCETILIMPNAFSPNKDNTNDWFVPIKKENITILKTVIYNKWGQEVYSTTNDLVNWDGKSKNGNLLPSGTYFWRLEYEVNHTGIKGKQSGIVHSLW